MAKLLGEYALQINSRLYARIPKAVLAAIAVSPQQNGGVGDTSGTADEYLLREWTLLWQQGIVPQRPPKA